MENEQVQFSSSAPHFCPWSAAGKAYGMLTKWAGALTLSVFLLLMRIVWGYGFFIAGKGKLLDISKPIGFFRQIGIPMPVANAWLVAIVECFGGLLLLFGIGGRVISLVLIINMAVAYLTTEHEALQSLFADSDPAKFIAAAPFWFMATAVLVFALGPGWFSVDGIVKCIGCRKSGAPCKLP
jgi:putative oxidoreductase